jgi:hypothetical protein
VKKLVLALAAMLLVAVSVVGVSSANPPIIIAEGFECTVLDGNGNAFVTTNSISYFYVNQRSAKGVLRCQGNGAPAPAVRHWNASNTGLTCFVLPFGNAHYWDNRVGRGGEAQLECTVNVNAEEPPPTALSSAAQGLR